MPRYIGKEMSRVDGVAKVTGKAKYTAEFRVPNLAYGFIVLGTVAKGTIKTIDTRQAEVAAGVIRVFTHLNAPKLGPRASTAELPPRATREPDRSFRALQSDRIYFNAQPVTDTEAVHNTSTFEEFSDDTTRFTRQVYACPNLYAPLKITNTDLITPT